VTDRDAAIYTREIVRQEGIFAGNSAGSAIAGLLQLKDRFKKGETVVVIFHDHGTRYLGKMFNPDWMRTMGYESVRRPHRARPRQEQERFRSRGRRGQRHRRAALRRMARTTSRRSP
jgi:cystathionine beta-synthase